MRCSALPKYSAMIEKMQLEGRALNRIDKRLDIGAMKLDTILAILIAWAFFGSLALLLTILWTLPEQEMRPASDADHLPCYVCEQ